jgi:predicted ATPase
LLNSADFMIRDFDFVSSDIPHEAIEAAPFSDEVKTQLKNQKVSAVQTVHAARNEEGDIVNSVAFDMSTQESRGTNIFFDLIIPILDCVENGKTMYIDEFSSSLHSDICEFIIKLFQDNKTEAKLLVNTHDQTLMKNGKRGLLGRDNIVIVEKDGYERTHITPLGKKRSIRKDDNIEKKYRYGLYGGRPFIRR